MKRIGVPIAQAEGSGTIVHIARTEESSQNLYLGSIVVRDQLKEDSASALQEARASGISRIVMLTGDNEEVAADVAAKVGITEYFSSLLPQDKVTRLQETRSNGSKVVFVGDGINDAPALAKADVGLAIGAGTDIAIESADIVLMKSTLRDVVTAVELSGAVLRNIRQNLFWAFFYNAIGIPVAAGILYPAFGITLNPMIAAAAMSLSSVCVVSNALRLRRYRTTEYNTHKEETTMTKTMKIEGMMCMHCSARVESVLNAIEGVSAKVDLEKKCAVVTLNAEVSDEVLRKAVTDAGYEVVSID